MANWNEIPLKKNALVGTRSEEYLKRTEGAEIMRIMKLDGWPSTLDIIRTETAKC